MNTVLIVVAVMFAVVMLLAIAGVGGWMYYDTRKRHRLMTDELKELSTRLTDINLGISEISKMPSYIEGMTKVCGDFVIQVSEMKELVEKFRLSLFGPERTKKEEERAAFQEYDDKAADDSFEIQQMVDQGFSVGEATQRVKGARAGRFTLG